MGGGSSSGKGSQQSQQAQASGNQEDFNKRAAEMVMTMGKQMGERQNAQYTPETRRQLANPNGPERHSQEFGYGGSRSGGGDGQSPRSANMPEAGQRGVKGPSGGRSYGNPDVDANQNSSARSTGRSLADVDDGLGDDSLG